MVDLVKKVGGFAASLVVVAVGGWDGMVHRRSSGEAEAKAVSLPNEWVLCKYGREEKRASRPTL